MSRDRIKKKPPKKRSKPRNQAEPTTIPESEDEMLARLPQDIDRLTTEDVRKVFGYSHKQSVYKMVMRGDLRAFKSRTRGKANVYKREDVVAAIRNRFKLIPPEEKAE